MVTDEELIERIKKKDAGALELLINRYHAPLHTYILRTTRNYYMTEEVVQETMIKVCTRASTYEYPKSAKCWIYKIATNIMRDKYRDKFTRYNVCNIGDEEVVKGIEQSGHVPAVCDLIELKETRNEVIKAVLALPQSYREIIILKFFNGLKVSEIAEITELPEGTVKSRIHYALKKLRNGNWGEDYKEEAK
jgi:RNA polymerase sigma-70 factor (ECF subfamily)